MKDIFKIAWRNLWRNSHRTIFTAAFIYNPYNKFVFVGPFFNFSISDNMSPMLVVQLFWRNSFTEFGNTGQMYYLDLKWSF